MEVILPIQGATYNTPGFQEKEPVYFHYSK